MTEGMGGLIDCLGEADGIDERGESGPEAIVFVIHVDVEITDHYHPICSEN